MSLAQLSQLLPLPEEELRQVVEYAASLSKSDAVSHLSDLLGDSPQTVDYIASFNARRKEPTNQPQSSSATSSATGPPSTRPELVKKKPTIRIPQARKPTEYAGPASTPYKKNTLDLDYLSQRTNAPGHEDGSRSSSPATQQSSNAPPKQHASSTGYLISDAASKTKSKRNEAPPNSAGKPRSITKMSITGGVPMTGQSTALADLNAAIRALEITTNPSLGNGKRRICNCVATRHALQSAAPNCLSCGKVICVKEGLGPCTFCGSSLLSPSDVQAVLRELKDERGREKMAANATANRRADVAKKPAPFSRPRDGTIDPDERLVDAAARAREHRDKLLSYQAQNARRTTVLDEAAEFDVSDALSGKGSLWADPKERAKELKRQQKLLLEMEWTAQPEYGKRRQVLSIDVVGGKVIRKMAPIERPVSPAEDEEDDMHDDEKATDPQGGESQRKRGAFSGNPLLGSLIKPAMPHQGQEPERNTRKTRWRRVQDDLNDEAVILDGGVCGGIAAEQTV